VQFVLAAPAGMAQFLQIPAKDKSVFHTLAYPEPAIMVYVKVQNVSSHDIIV